MRDAPPSSSGVLGAMQALAVDENTAEVAGALEAAGVEFLLLKGPAIAQWLYAEGGRSYVDTDLLVPQHHEGRAEHVLAALGFNAAPGTGWEDPGVARNHVWLRGKAIVELHVTLTGIGVSPGEVWTTLSAGAETMGVRGRTVHILGLPARLLHVALHAAQHGPEFGKASRDLELACAVHGTEDWREAAALAVRLCAVDALSAGLDLVPDGVSIKRELMLPEASDPLVLLRAKSASPVALGIARFARDTTRGRMKQVSRVLLPTPSFLRWWTPLASRGPLGLLAAYVWRYVHLAGALPGALRSFRLTRGTRATANPPDPPAPRLQ